MKLTKKLQHSWRVVLFAAFLQAGFLLLIARLVDIQVVRGAALLERADANRFFSLRIPAERGIIYDRYNQPLTYNKPRYYRLQNPENLYSERTPISAEEAMQLKATDSAHLSYELERGYIFPKSISHIVGYTGLVSADDLLSDTSLYADDKIGKLGLEKQFDSFLRGQSGYDVYEINALGKRQRVVEQKTGKPGGAVNTTLDPFLSEVAFQALGSNKGSVVILDSDTAEVLTMVSTPSYDSDLLSTRKIDLQAERERKNAVNAYFEDPNKVFFNRALSGTYPPGSVFKLITALAGLEDNAFDPSTTVEDEGVLKVGEYTYANWYYTQYGGKEGTISLQKAIARSNDIYFYKAAEWIGPQSLADAARMFGLGAKTGIDVSGEAAGLVPDPKWKEEVVGERWFLGNTYHFGIGQADLLVTPLQVAHYTQALGHNGLLCQPYLVRNPLPLGTQMPQCREMGVHEDNLKVVISGMLDACSAGGTAFPFFEHNTKHRSTEAKDSYEELKEGAIACKTGTAEFGGVDEKGYRKTHGWFTTIVDTEALLSESNLDVNAASPSAELSVETSDVKKLHSEWLQHVKNGKFPKRLAIVVMVESDEQQPYKEGSRDAGPIAKSIVTWMQGSYQVPKVELAPVGQGE